ncbi:hypothetical protein N7488_008106 [Penicillium malachiteum]|nr:hypothetical protein N7488_008106 [Penicillium malachiteum]
MAGHGHPLPLNRGGSPSNDATRGTSMEIIEPSVSYALKYSPPALEDDKNYPKDSRHRYPPWQSLNIGSWRSTSSPHTSQTIGQRAKPEPGPYDLLEPWKSEMPLEPPKPPKLPNMNLERRGSFIRAREEPLDLRESKYAAYDQTRPSQPNDRYYYESPPDPDLYKYGYRPSGPSTQGHQTRSRSRERKTGLELISEYNRTNNSDEDSFGYRTGIRKSTRDRSDGRATRSISSGRLGHRSRSRSRSRSRRRDNRRASYKYGPPHDETISGMQLASYEESHSRKEGVSKAHRDDSKPVKEEVSLAQKGQAPGIPSGARWTKINRRLVSPAALEAGKERFEERSDHVIVLRVLSKEEIEEYALRTRDLRDGDFATWLTLDF